MKCNIFITFLTRYLLIEYKNLSAITEPTSSKMILINLIMMSTTVAGSFAYHRLDNYEKFDASADFFIMIYMTLMCTGPSRILDTDVLEYYTTIILKFKKSILIMQPQCDRSC
jgi:hypothetical protein